MTLLEEIIAYKNEPNPLIPRYVAYIKDTSIPLDERWAVFKEAPDEWKEHETYVQSFKFESYFGGEISWYDDFYTERHATVDMVGFCEWRIEDHFCDRYEEGDAEGQALIQACITACKEEVMQKNLGSFEFDW